MLPKLFPVTCHTDLVGPGSTFIVIKGQTTDGLQFVETALQKGATTIVVQEDVLISDELQQKIKQVGAHLKLVKNTRIALAELSAQAAGYPAQKLKLIGITGTKGKTTTSHILYHLLVSAGCKVALLGTVENKISTILESFKSPLTTPQPDYLHQFFKLCVAEKVEYVVMETAAQAITFHRLETIQFDATVFTNLDREHGELYPTMEEYFETKCQLFKFAKPGAPCLVNVDDKWGAKVLREYPEGKCECCSGESEIKARNFISFGTNQFANYQALCQGVK